MLLAPLKYVGDAAFQSPRNLLFLDRDGVLNRRISGSYVLSRDDLQINYGILDVLRPYSARGVACAIVSNQSCVGRGLLDGAVLRGIMRTLTLVMESAGISLIAWYCCPHVPGQGCPCRKPRPGMFFEAAADLKVDLRATCFIGDTSTDALSADAAGIRRFIKYDMDIDSFDGLSGALKAAYGH